METCVEQFVRKFVLGKTEEKVALHLTPRLHIRPVKKKGSILLAVFWANLLQHPDNYPKGRYSYKKMIDRSTGKETLVVRVPEGDLTISITMETGTLTIEAKDIYAWFKDNFTKLLDNYDDQFKEQFKYDSKSSPGKKSRRSVKDSNRLLPRDTSSSELDRKVKTYADEYIPGLEYLAIHDQEYLSEEELNENLSSLSSGGLHDGYTCVYKTWKSLLRKWFRTENVDIYIVTPQIDEKRLKDVVDCFVKGQVKGNLKACYLPRYCDGSKTVADLKRPVIKSYPETRLHVIIEHYIYRNILLPINKEFEGKFIAGVNSGTAEVLITSAGFNGQHFRNQNMQTAQFLTMSEEIFKEKYLSGVESPTRMTLL